MPELAEVEYYRKQWDCGLGERITAVQLHASKRIFRGIDTGAMRRHITGKRLLRSFARGKQMLFEFSGGNWLGLHLGMSGTLRSEGPQFQPAKHDHLVLQQRRRALVFRDPRLFGRVKFHHGKTEPEWWTTAPPEIASTQFSAGYFSGFLRRHGRAPIRPSSYCRAAFPASGTGWRMRSSGAAGSLLPR
ncbi:MAG: DNA-formamidopyrimidine glycosylase family protein [Chthoniobacterales bacterium]